MIPKIVVGILILVITCGAQNILWDTAKDSNIEEDVCIQKVDFFGKGMFNNRLFLPLPNDFSPGSEIEVFGYTPLGTESIMFNFNPHQSWLSSNYDIILHFNPRFNTGFVVTNTFINGQWVYEYVIKNTFLIPGQNYTLKFVCTVEEFKIWINGVDFPSYKHQADPKLIKDLEIEKPLFVHHVIYKTNRPCKIDNSKNSIWSFSKVPYVKEKTCTQTLNFFGRGMYSEYFILSLPSNLRPGTEVGISGNIPSTTDNVVINFIPTQDWNDIKNIALHFNPRFWKGTILRNSMLNGAWQNEEISENINLVKGQNFTLKLISTDENYIMVTNGVQFGTFRHRGNPNTVTTIQSTAPLFIDHIDYKTNRSCENKKKETENYNLEELNDNVHTIRFFGKGMFCEKLGIPLPGDMRPGTVLEIYGTILHNSSNLEFQLNPEATRDTTDKIDFRFNPSFINNIIVRNITVDKISGRTINSSPLNLIPGNDFTIMINSTEKGYKISTNGINLPVYKHWLDPTRINFFHLNSPVFLSRIVYKTKEKLNTANDSTKMCKVSNFDDNSFIKEVAFFGMGAHLTNFIIPLPDTFRSGTELQIFGTLPAETLNMEINLILHQKWNNIKNIALKIHFKFAEGVVVVSSIQGELIDEETTCKNIITPGYFFNIRIISTIEGYEIWANGKELAFYNHKIDTELVDDLQIVGDTLIHQIIYKKLWLLTF